MKKIFTSFFVIITYVTSGQVVFTSSDLPIIKINTSGVEIPDDPKIDATMGIINNGAGARNNVTDPFNEYNGNIGIEIRGHSSQMFPMKSYSIELRDADGEDNDQPLFGLPKESDWVLYAPYTDKTLMRNVLAYNISNNLGHWAAHCKYVEVILNYEYIGVYVFMERIKRDKGRVNIKKLENTDTAGDALTGGYIFSIDKDADGWYSYQRPPNSPTALIQYSYVYPKAEDILQIQKSYIKSYVDSFEAALIGPDFTNTQNGYRKFADENSFIDYFIVNELSRNVDGYRLSSYFYKDRNSEYQKIIAGPVWDYDLAFRNADYCDGSNVEGWAYNFNYVCSDDYYQVPFWWDRFMEDPLFKSNLLCRWTSLRQTVLKDSAINNLIDSASNIVSEAQQRHFTKWPVLGQYVWPNPSPIPTSYSGELSALKTWIANRLIWIDNNLPQFGGCAVILGEEDTKFNVIRVLNNAHLTWQTTSEINSDHFIIERSIDGINFTDIATIKAAGNSNTTLSYQYDDPDVTQYNIEKIYYRIKLLSDVGLGKPGSTISLIIKNSPAEIKILPNPIAENLNIVLETNNEEHIKITVINSIGKTMIFDEKNLVQGTNLLKYNSGFWAKGIYFLKIIADNGETSVEKFVK